MCGEVYGQDAFLVFSGVAGVIVVLMLLAAIYDYSDSRVRDLDVESSSNSNNNEKLSTYPDKNFPDERRISIIQDNGKELIERSEMERKEVKTRRSEKTKRGKGTWLPFAFVTMVQKWTVTIFPIRYSRGKKRNLYD